MGETVWEKLSNLIHIKIVWDKHKYSIHSLKNVCQQTRQGPQFDKASPQRRTHG